MARVSKNKSRQLDVVETPDLTAEIDRERKRLAGDFQSFCIEKLRIINIMGEGGVDMRIKFKWNQCQAALNRLIENVGDFLYIRGQKLAEYDNKIKISRMPTKEIGEILVLKARKVGVSTFLEARAFWRCSMFANQKALIMAHERPAAQNIADISQRFDTFWDPNEKIPIKVPLDRSSDDLLEWAPYHGSSMVVETAGTKGEGSSRSFSYQFVHMSERAFFPQESKQVAAALSARTPFCETYSESTANGEGNQFYDKWQNAMWYEEIVALWKAGKSTPKNWNGCFKFFWPWYSQDENRLALLPHEEEEITQTLDDEEKTLIEDFNLTVHQLAWRRAQIAGVCSEQSSMQPKEFFKQEWPATPEEAFVAKSQNIFDPKKLQAMSIESRTLQPAFKGFLIHDPEDPIGFKMIEGGNWLVPSGFGSPVLEGSQFVQWELPHDEGSYVMGADSAEGLEHGDWSVISIFERFVDHIVEVGRVRSKTPAEELGELAYFLARMYNNAYLVAERNPPGNAMCAKLVDLGYAGYMWHHRPIETVTNMESPEKFTAGFKTMVNTKAMIVHKGVNGLRNNQIILRHPDAIKEWKQFSCIDGKYNAPSGKSDDCVMADLLALFGNGEAPPLIKSSTTKITKSQVELKPEEAQNQYWKARILDVRKEAATQHKKRAEIILKRTKMLDSFWK